MREARTRTTRPPGPPRCFSLQCASSLPPSSRGAPEKTPLLSRPLRLLLRRAGGSLLLGRRRCARHRPPGSRLVRLPSSAASFTRRRSSSGSSASTSGSPRRSSLVSSRAPLFFVGACPRLSPSPRSVRARPRVSRRRASPSPSALGSPSAASPPAAPSYPIRFPGGLEATTARWAEVRCAALARPASEAQRNY